MAETRDVVEIALEVEGRLRNPPPEMSEHRVRLQGANVIEALRSENERLRSLAGSGEPVAWMSQVQHVSGSWMAFRPARWTRESAEMDIKGMFGVFRIVALYPVEQPEGEEAAGA
jgi:hypothetical protein